MTDGGLFGRGRGRQKAGSEPVAHPHPSAVQSHAPSRFTHGQRKPPTFQSPCLFRDLQAITPARGPIRLQFSGALSRARPALQRILPRVYTSVIKTLAANRGKGQWLFFGARTQGLCGSIRPRPRSSLYRVGWAVLWRMPKARPSPFAATMGKPAACATEPPIRRVFCQVYSARCNPYLAIFSFSVRRGRHSSSITETMLPLWRRIVLSISMRSNAST